MIKDKTVDYKLPYLLVIRSIYIRDSTTFNLSKVYRSKQAYLLQGVHA